MTSTFTFIIWLLEQGINLKLSRCLQITWVYVEFLITVYALYNFVCAISDIYMINWNKCISSVVPEVTMLSV
jgi:hypothetical protein